MLEDHSIGASKATLQCWGTDGKDCSNDARPTSNYCQECWDSHYTRPRRAGYVGSNDRKLTPQFWSGVFVGTILTGLVCLVAYLTWTV